MPGIPICTTYEWSLAVIECYVCKKKKEESIKMVS